MKKLISCILALLLLTTAAFAVPGDSCVVLGEELTLGETDGIFTALGVERAYAPDRVWKFRWFILFVPYII